MKRNREFRQQEHSWDRKILIDMKPEWNNQKNLYPYSEAVYKTAHLPINCLLVEMERKIAISLFSLS